MTWPRHIRISGGADGRRRKRCTIGMTTQTTAAKLSMVASRAERSDTSSATIANPRARTTGEASSSRAFGGIIDSIDDADCRGAGLGPGGLEAWGGGGRSRIFSFFERISSNSRSSRDLPVPSSEGVSAGGDCMLTILSIEVMELFGYGTVRGHRFKVYRSMSHRR